MVINKLSSRKLYFQTCFEKLQKVLAMGAQFQRTRVVLYLLENQTYYFSNSSQTEIYPESKNIV